MDYRLHDRVDRARRLGELLLAAKVMSGGNLQVTGGTDNAELALDAAKRYHALVDAWEASLGSGEET